MTDEEIIEILERLKLQYARDWTVNGNKINLALKTAIDVLKQKVKSQQS